jgi:hypothetical protein
VSGRHDPGALARAFEWKARSKRLRQTLEEACTDARLSMKALTVLAVQNDPFRIDTPAGHRDGSWFAKQLEIANRVEPPVRHLRGAHYRFLGVSKPDDTPYTNTDEAWSWLQEKAADPARWLGYVPFEAFEDRRNAAPVIRRHVPTTPYAFIGVGGLDVEIPDVDDLEPYVGVTGFQGEQPYKLVIFGEKSSLEDVLAPIAEQCDADLYLPTGEISDTLLHTMASEGAGDGRTMIVLTVSDCDPAGWQMPISIARKLQAFQALEFADLSFQVHRVGLLPEQVRDLDLPSTPLKASERRADRWTQQMGVQQTEIDALMALNPAVLAGLVLQAIHPFFDESLAQRVGEAEAAWREQAWGLLDATLDADGRHRIRAEAAEKLAGLEHEIDAIRDSLHVDVGDVELPEIAVPEPDLSGREQPEPLVDSRWGFVKGSLALRRSKEYEQ